MSKVKRLPKQHRTRPHCAACDAEMPGLAGMQIVLMPEEVEMVEVLQVTLQVRCPCGAQWCLVKRVADHTSSDPKENG